MGWKVSTHQCVLLLAGFHPSSYCCHAASRGHNTHIQLDTRGVHIPLAWPPRYSSAVLCRPLRHGPICRALKFRASGLSRSSCPILALYRIMTLMINAASSSLPASTPSSHQALANGLVTPASTGQPPAILSPRSRRLQYQHNLLFRPPHAVI
ncbi:hypothetical protein FA95DRAFT_966379 [Auriscalpium vulgare]|uniref:Uncharacterized protein n=1 Tax=Auriscalpium vulgare TaxID=40419 RepID=A0ACB8R730_9AGAM|nr:hypothetical protein FA95DRAFT_966379 [Auriscalpium vulgare]